MKCLWVLVLTPNSHSSSAYEITLTETSFLNSFRRKLFCSAQSILVGRKHRRKVTNFHNIAYGHEAEFWKSYILEFKQQGIQLNFVVVLFVLFCFVCSMNLTLIIKIKLCKLEELSGDQNNTPKFQPLLLVGRSVSIVTQQKWVQMLLRLFFPLYPSPYSLSVNEYLEFPMDSVGQLSTSSEQVIS